MHGKGRVLLVSPPDVALASRTTRALSFEGYEVRLARNTDAASMLLLGMRPLDAIVLVALPENAATIILKAIAAEPDLARVPVILAGDANVLAATTWAQVRKPRRAAAALRALSQVCSVSMI